MGSTDRDAAVTHLTSARAPTASASLPRAAAPHAASAPLEPPPPLPTRSRSKKLARPVRAGVAGAGRGYSAASGKF